MANKSLQGLSRHSTGGACLLCRWDCDPLSRRTDGGKGRYAPRFASSPSRERCAALRCAALPLTHRGARSTAFLPPAHHVSSPGSRSQTAKPKQPRLKQASKQASAPARLTFHPHTYHGGLLQTHSAKRRPGLHNTTAAEPASRQRHSAHPSFPLPAEGRSSGPGRSNRRLPFH